MSNTRLDFGTLSSGLHFCSYPFWWLSVWMLGAHWPSVWGWAEWSKSDCVWLLVMCDTTSAIHGVFLLCLVVPKWDFSVLVSRAHGIRAFMRSKPVKQKLSSSCCLVWTAGDEFTSDSLPAIHKAGSFSVRGLCSFPPPISRVRRGQWAHTSCFWMSRVEMMLRNTLNWSEKKQKPPEAESETEEK